MQPSQPTQSPQGSQTNLTIKTAGNKKAPAKKAPAKKAAPKSPNLRSMTLAQLKKLDAGVDGQLGETD